MEVEHKKHYHFERKRATVAAYREAQRQRQSGELLPMLIAQAASGGASEPQIFRWLHEDLSDEALAAKKASRKGRRLLSEDQEQLLLGYAIFCRMNLKSVTLQSLTQFSENYLQKKLSTCFLSRLMSRHGLSSQQAMSRNSRMTSVAVVDAAVEAIESIRLLNLPPHRIIAMDETGLWSKVTQPRTYNFKNWFVIFIFLQVPFLLIFPIFKSYVLPLQVFSFVILSLHID